MIGGAVALVLVIAAAVSGASDDNKAETAAPTTSTTERERDNSRPAADPTTTTTEAMAKQGTRENPSPNGSALTIHGDTDSYNFAVGPLTQTSIDELDDYYRNDPTSDFNQPNTAIYKTTVTVTNTGTQPLSGTSIQWNLGVTGSKGTIYDAASMVDFDENLGLLDEQPEVLQGGMITGQVYFVVDATDANFLYVWNSTFGFGEVQYINAA